MNSSLKTDVRWSPARARLVAAGLAICFPLLVAVLAACSKKALPTTEILFLSDRDGEHELYAMDVDGGQVRRVLSVDDLPPGGQLSRPVWNPALGRLFFSVSTTSNADIYVCDRSGDHLQNLTDTPSRYEDHPVPSPSGDLVAYTVVSFDLDVGVMDSSGGNPRNLTAHPARDVSPRWGPGEDRLLFSSNREGTPNIYTMTLDGREVTNLSRGKGQDGSFSWSPDGSQIVFESDRDGAKDIFVMGAEGGDILNLTETPQRRETSPIWSPDGTQIAFYVEDQSGWDIYTISSGGGLPQVITHTPAVREFSMAWSPGGEKILFTAKESEYFDIYVYDLAKKDLLRLTQNKANDYAPFWVQVDGL